MIYIVEVPHQFPPKVWSRPNKEQIMSLINAEVGDTIYEEKTGRDLLEMFGYDSTLAMRQDNDALTTIADLIDAYGLDASYYKGYGVETYGIDPIDEWEAHLEWNGHDLSAQRVYMNDAEARAALADDSKWHIHQGVEARAALKKELEFCNE